MATADPATDSASRCEAPKLAATGRYAVASARCRAPAHGGSPDVACLVAAAGRLTRGYVHAAAKGPCPAGGDVAGVQPTLDDGVVALATALQTGTAGFACGAAKLLAAARYGGKLLKARAQDVTHPDPTRLSAKDGAARAALITTFTSLQSQNGCLTNGDATTVAAQVDAMVAEVVARVEGTPPLRTVAEARGRWIGSAVRASVLAAEPRYGDVLAREYDYVIPEQEGNWITLKPTADASYDWGPLDSIVDFAQAHGMRVKMGALVWWFLLPDYVQAMTPEELRAATEERVRTFVSRYRGRVAVYDVVNEPFLAGTALFPSLFMQKLGPGYVADALRWAREEDPDALLMLNDFGIEDLNPSSDAFYAFVQQLLADGVPLDGIGLEMHVGLTPEPVHLSENIQRFADLGLKVGITELDVQISHLPGDLPTRLAAQAATYHRIAAACAASPACYALSTWGFTDKYTWIDNFFPDDPLPLDDLYRPKPAWFALRDALAGD